MAGALRIEVTSVGDSSGGKIAIDIGGEHNRGTELNNVSLTHLNVCAVLGELGRHEAALQHAQCAVQLMRVQGIGRGDRMRAGGLDTYAIACHNLASEHEHLGQMNAAAAVYAEAVTAAEQCWGSSHSKTLTMRCITSLIVVCVVSTPTRYECWRER